MTKFNQRVDLLGANQYVIREDEKVIFQSYTTVIAIYNKNTHELELNSDNWKISRTTMKYFKDFINYHTKFRYESKKEFEKMIENSIEIQEL